MQAVIMTEGIMAHLLHIDASPRGERSHSRRMTREFVAQWQQVHPSDTVTYRDLGHQPVPYVDEPWIAAAFTPPEQHTPEMWNAIRLSDQLVDEFLAADIHVIGVPMYNFSVPGVFKSYIDQIVRVGRTVIYGTDDSTNGFQPLVLGKKMFVIESRGAAEYQPGGQYETMNHHDPYLVTVFGFIGITDITFIHVGNDVESISKARAHVIDLIAA